MLQVYGLVPILSARENVSLALRARGVKPAEAEELPEAALARFHIADLGDRQVEELSGGQMQRVARARGLVVGAEVLLADEPTSELDEGNRSLVLSELRREAARGGRRGRDPRPGRGRRLRPALRDRRGRLTDHVAAVDLAQFARPERRLIEEAVPPHFDEAYEPAPSAGSAPPAPEPAPEATPEPVAASPRRITDSDAAFRRPPTDSATLHEPHAPGRLVPARDVAAAAPPHRGRRGGRGLHRPRVRRPGGHLAAARRTPPAARGRGRPRHRPGARQRPPHRDRDRPAARPAGR